MKDSSTIVAVANLAGLIGTTVYFYKNMEAMRVDMGKMSLTINTILKRITELEKNNQEETELLTSLNKEVKEFSEKVEEMPQISTEMMDRLDNDLDEVFAVLKEHGITIDREEQNNFVKPIKSSKDKQKKPKIRVQSRIHQELEIPKYKQPMLLHKEDIIDEEDIINEVRRKQVRGH